MRKPKPRRPHNDLSRSLTPLNLNHTLIAVIELSQKSWVVAGIIPGVERQPLKKFESGEDALLSLIDRWRKEAEKAGHKIERIAVAFEAGRDGFWLARWLRARGIEALSPVAEYSLKVGNENSLVGIAARWRRARPAPSGFSPRPIIAV